MPRPRRDGKPSRSANRRALTALHVSRAKPQESAFNVWDTKERGLVLRIQPTGKRAFKVVYSWQGRPRWYHVGDVPLEEARRIATKIRVAVAEGKDPAAERKAERGAGTFGEMADRYLEEHAKKKNKSWRQARWLVEHYVLPRWGKLDARGVTRSDVRALVNKIGAPILANQILASVSAIFSWAPAGGSSLAVARRLSAHSPWPEDH